MDTRGPARVTLALASCALFGCTYAPMHAPTEDGRATLTLPARRPDLATLELRTHPAIEAYRNNVETWATDEERARFGGVDASHTFTARSGDLESLAIERFVHRILPLLLEAQPDPVLQDRGRMLRALELDGPYMHRLDPGEVFAALSSRRDDHNAETSAAAMRLHAEAIAEFAEAYAELTGVSARQADRVALAVDGVGTVALLTGRIAACPDVARPRVVDEAQRLFHDLVRTARGGR